MKTGKHKSVVYRITYLIGALTMQLPNGQNYRNLAYTLALPAMGVPFLAEIEEHWHRPCGRRSS